MIITISDLQKQHLQLLHRYSIQVLVDFCRLAIAYFDNGRDNLKYMRVAERLGVHVRAVEDLIHALVYLISEACKYNLSELDFRTSLAINGFSAEQQDVLVKFFNTKKLELSTTLSALHEQNYHRYQDLIWRFEVQIASKTCPEEIKPFVSMDFILINPKNYGQRKELEKFGGNKIISMVNTVVNASISEAKTASQCQYMVKHVMLQCDIQNLTHLTNKLDQALKESKNQHVRKVQRVLQ